MMQAENELNREIDRLVDLKMDISSVTTAVRNENYRLVSESGICVLRTGIRSAMKCGDNRVRCAMCMSARWT